MGRAEGGGRVMENMTKRQQELVDMADALFDGLEGLSRADVIELICKVYNQGLKDAQTTQKLK